MGISARIFSNSFLNVFQKLLTNSGEKSSVVNFYMYLGLTVLGFVFCPHPVFSSQLLVNVAVMGLLGALGNYFIIKALSLGDLSELAPINAYKPVVALVLGIFIIGEIPGIREILGIILIIFGTMVLLSKKFSSSKALFYRALALIFSGTEALFIKKVIILSDINSAFLFWAVSGLVFSLLIAVKHPIKISLGNIKYMVLLVAMAGIMQYSTNYLFAKMNVAYALALFQLSVLLSVFLGVNVFKEKGLIRKLCASFIMIFGTVLIILN